MCDQPEAAGYKSPAYYVAHPICSHRLQPFVERYLAACGYPSQCPHISPATEPLHHHTAGCDSADHFIFNMCCALAFFFIASLQLQLARHAS